MNKRRCILGVVCILMVYYFVVFRSDFLSLPFQAIECSLAGVRPAGKEWCSGVSLWNCHPQNKVKNVFVSGEVWTEAALDDFERMTYCAEWKPLLAKLYSYSHSEISSWPSVKLYDNSQGKVRGSCGVNSHVDRHFKLIFYNITFQSFYFADHFIS